MRLRFSGLWPRPEGWPHLHVWVAWQLHNQFERPSRRISGADPLDSLKNYGTKLRASVEALASIANLEALKEKKLHEVDRLIEQPEGLNRLPGKQILRRFLDEHADISSEDYLNVAVSTVLDKGITLGEIERLKGAISKRRGT